MTAPSKGYLVLDDRAGTRLPGVLVGAPLDYARDRGFGEVVFNTSMTGYQEILTDPSYYGQMICMTTPHIGNTGVNLEDAESRKPWCSGFLFHTLSPMTSNWRSTQDLESYLRENGIPALVGVETRTLTRVLRSQGVIRGILVQESEANRACEILRDLPQFEGRDLIREVTTPQPYEWPCAGERRFRVVALDFGIKWNLLRMLGSLGCSVDVLPATASAQDVLERKPDGVFLSNGPGDPTAAPYAVDTVRQLVDKLPVFGVCMGHQLLSLALGGQTYKLKFGHRGGNQPVFDLATRKVEISSHNHGYSVDAESLPPGVVVTHTNLNDGTVEGISVENRMAYSVQYHPEACPGPHDSSALFERFIDMMKDFRSGRRPTPSQTKHVDLCTKSTLNL